ncbi:uncharacterized protein LOC111603664 [Drosophila hydei]|uniref:Uncharacterized protein LOC111603664 n=1 Tax=Drosophila hydei TaxID=7224 RepID=A0A6J1MDW8_DROHY|nr:uncharacterized protein LOC111603664 [Drosophila hydei]
MDPPRTAQCIVCSAVVVTLILLFGFLAYFLYIYVYGYAVDEFRSKFLSLLYNTTFEANEIGSVEPMIEDSAYFFDDCKDKKS